MRSAVFSLVHFSASNDTLSMLTLLALSLLDFWEIWELQSVTRCLPWVLLVFDPGLRLFS